MLAVIQLPRYVGTLLCNIGVVHSYHTVYRSKPDEASTHKSVNTHAGTVLCLRPQNQCISRTHGGPSLCRVWCSLAASVIDIVPRCHDTFPYK